MAECKRSSGLDDIEVVDEAIEIDIDEKVSHVASNKFSTRNDTTNAWKIQGNAARY